MVSLVPGTLLKLLKHMNTNTKISNKHQSSLLQIISIVPSLNKDDLFSSNGFFLKVSDSSHATYVSLPSEQNELISSDKIKLGQYIYIQSLQASTPVPIVQGMQPIPGRRPCVGNPEDLASTNFLQNEISKDKVKISITKEKSSTVKKVLVTKEKTSIKVEKKEAVTVKRRSLTLKESPLSTKNCCSISGSVDKFSRNVQEQEKVKSTGKPPSILRRGSVSTVLKTNTNTVNKDLISSMDMGPKSSRKSWDGCLPMKRNDSSKIVSSERKVEAKLENRATANVPCRKLLKYEKLISKEEKCVQSSSKKVSSVSSDVNKNKLKMTRASLSEKATATTSSLNPDSLVKVSLNKSRKWTDGSVSWASIQSPLQKLGKEVMKYRDAARQAAIDAIQEASNAENLIRCLSMYAELCSTASEANPDPTVKQFLKLYDTLTLIKPVSTRPDHATSWVQAAISTGLAPFSLYTDKSTHTNFSVILEGPKNINQRTPPMSSSSSSEEEESCKWESGGGAPEQAELAHELKNEAGKWFLKFVDRFLDVDNIWRKGFKEREKVNGMILQLKNVNDWLDGVEKSLKEGVHKDFNDIDVTLETICRIKKKIYKYLLAHVGNE